ncbi:hypothetical protein ACIHDR_24220 [Nocardia sp. NPDC052278]|uniref:hypothetical protein n=1 Tax=unclassified Nocardia TaxID=2637762 RepID=UPI003688DB4B
MPENAMVCCLLLARLLTALREFVDPTTPRVARVPWFHGRLVLPALAEIAIGALIVIVIAQWGPRAQGRHAGHMGMAMSNESPATPLFDNHVVWMALLSFASTLVPLAVVCSAGSTLPWIQALLNRLPLTLDAVVWVAILLVWHIPSLHSAVVGSGIRMTGLVLLTVVVALPIWSRVAELVTTKPATAPFRESMPLLLAFEITMLFGAALALSPSSWVMGPGVAPLQEQRLSGVVMLTVDIAVFLYLLHRRRRLENPISHSSELARRPLPEGLS